MIKTNKPINPLDKEIIQEQIPQVTKNNIIWPGAEYNPTEHKDNNKRILIQNTH